MNFARKEKVKDFNKKSAKVSRALSSLLSRIEGMHVKPWSFGLDRRGDFCGILKVDEIDEQTMNKLIEVSKGGFSLYLATNNACYVINSGEVKTVDPYDCKEYVNKQITNFRMSLISP